VEAKPPFGSSHSPCCSLRPRRCGWRCWKAPRSAVTHGRPSSPPQPDRQPGPCRYLRHLLGERLLRTPRLLAVPAALTPPQLSTLPAHLQIPGPGDRPALHPPGNHPAHRAGTSSLISSAKVHHRPYLAGCDLRDRQAIQTQQPGRIVDHARGSSLVIFLPRQQEGSRRAAGPSTAYPAGEQQPPARATPLNFEEPLSAGTRGALASPEDLRGALPPRASPTSPGSRKSSRITFAFCSRTRPCGPSTP
jgi:hypothetical protein